MKIKGLRAENVMRLKVVDIAPDGTLQVIGGKNGAGKSSLLNAIYLALAGGKAAKETIVPLRDGEVKGSVRLDLGDIIVTRSWTQKGTTLKVESKEGLTYSSPQALLDGLMGRLSFDPLAFTRLSPKDQRAALADLVGVDTDELDHERGDLYQQRTEIGRRIGALGEIPTVDESLPVEETLISAHVAALQEADEANRTRDEWEGKAIIHSNAAEDLRARILEKEAELVSLREAEKREGEAVRAATDELDKLGPPTDTAPLIAALESAEATNRKIRDNNTARDSQEYARELADLRDDLTRRIGGIDEAKADLLAHAEFPVPGLGFDDLGVTFDGIHFSQASSAQQIRVSLAMGMALNPKLRVLIIRDGSLLDEDSMAAIREQVAGKDFQLLVERVGSGDAGAVVLDEGEVV